MIGADIMDPKTPPLEIVKVPPDISSSSRLLFFAFSARFFKVWVNSDYILTV